MWPDNIDSVNVFSAMSTQWEVGPGGVIGLRYEALPAIKEALRIGRRKWAQVFQDLMVMEDEALATFRALAKQRR